MKVVLDMVISMDQVIFPFMFSNIFIVFVSLKCNEMLLLITENGEYVKIL